VGQHCVRPLWTQYQEPCDGEQTSGIEKASLMNCVFPLAGRLILVSDRDVRCALPHLQLACGGGPGKG
jgi:hypothetical protein